jgi:hypothetical protein
MFLTHLGTLLKLCYTFKEQNECSLYKLSQKCDVLQLIKPKTKHVLSLKIRYLHQETDRGHKYKGHLRKLDRGGMMLFRY